MVRRSNSLAGIWAETQRRQQREREARHRQWVRQRQEEERTQRAAERDAARSHRERQAAYKQHREADARRRTDELDSRVEELTGLLAAGCALPGFRAASLALSEHLPPFAPGALGLPVPLPDPAAYRPQQTAWGLGGRREQDAAQARYQHDWHAARAAEDERLRQLTLYQGQYEQWATAELARVRQHNAEVATWAQALRSGDPDAVVAYFTAALYASVGWPEGLPRQLEAGYDPAARQLVVDWELPGFDAVPAAKSVRYVAVSDEERETARPPAQRRALYRDTLAQCVLLALRELFAADEYGVLSSVTLNGYVDEHDPATGRRGEIFLATVTADRAVFAELHLEQVSAVDCLADALRGRLSARPDQLLAVPPGRRPRETGGTDPERGAFGDEDPDLFAMDPIAFESLVADLFRARGMRAVTTQRSNDGGVDVDAVDPDPLSGGRIVIQVKRYRNTVPPTAVRDLYGTVQDAGANKGILVTTSGFGPGSYAFARGKPLTLVSGPELVDLMGRHGLRGRLGDAAARPAAPAPVPDPRRPSAPAPRFSEVGLTWEGPLALDLCALVCADRKVLGDDHFVFFNNPGTPDGTVRMADTPAPGSRAAVRVAFAALAPAADRVVIAAAVDAGDAGPAADLAGLTGALLRLSDASGAAPDTLAVGGGRTGETALVLGAFRRRAGGDWDFAPGGPGYTGGLAALVEDFGVEVG